MTPYDPAAEKVLLLISKLLKVQEGKGATEAEAALAAEHVQRLLQDHQLTLAQVEATSGAVATGKRAKAELDLSAARPWQAYLMASLAENNFCLHRTYLTAGAGKRKRHLLVGREVNVRATRETYVYLERELRRRMADAGYQVAHGNRYDPDGTNFLDGAVERLRDRLGERRRQREAESQAREAAARQASQGARALVLADAYGSEADLNNDELNGFPHGTTKARRDEQEARRAAMDARQRELVAGGMDATEAWYRAHGYGDAEVAQMLAYSAAEAARPARQSRGSSRGRSQRWSTRSHKEYERVNSTSYRAGVKAGDAVGLDDQVGQAAPRRLR